MRDHVYNMSDDKLVKYLLQEASAAERRQVETWIAADATNQRYFEQFRLIWERSRQLAATGTVDAEMAWQRFQQRVNNPASANAKVLSIDSRFMIQRIAAILVAAVAIIAILYFFSERGASDKPVTFATTQNSGADTLSDGSVITLNKNSSLTYPQKFRKDNRTVALKGEAFFNITPDKKKPFVIKVNGLTIKVVGTSFNIRTAGEMTEVVVETGIVEVSNGHQTISVAPKEKIQATSSQATLQKEKVTDQLYKYYRNKEFVCDRTPLWKLVEVLNEAYDAHIVIKNEALKSIPLTTTFYNQPIEKILEIIAETIDIEVEHNNTEIVLK